MSSKKTETVVTTITEVETSDTVNDTKMSPATFALRKKLLGAVTIADRKLAIDPETYLKHLPADLPKELVQKLHDYNDAFYPAITWVAGEVSIDEMKKDSSIKELSLDVPLYGDDKFNIHIERERSFSIPKSDKTVTKYARVTTGLETRSHSPKHVGDMQSVHHWLADEAHKAFAG